MTEYDKQDVLTIRLMISLMADREVAPKMVRDTSFQSLLLYITGKLGKNFNTISNEIYAEQKAAKEQP